MMQHRKHIPSLKQKLHDKEPTIGSWLSFNFGPVCELMAGAGFDWLVIDMEHTPTDYNDAHDLIRIIELSGVTPLVRVGANDPLIIKRVMDAGAHGVLVPQVNTVEQAQEAVAAAYYPPTGIRGVGLHRAQGYGLDFDAYRQWAHNNTVVIVQIEHHVGVDNLEAILDVEGVDGFIIGPYDLSASLGLAGELDHPAVVEQLRAAEQIMRASSKVGGYHVVHGDPAGLQRRLDAGYLFIAYGVDMVFFADKLKGETDAIRHLL